MIQGSILPSFINRKMTYKGPLEMAPDKSCLVIPPIFLKGKAIVKKDEAFSFATETELLFHENLITVEWHPDLERYSKGAFHGTPAMGPDLEPRRLRGAMVAKKEFNVRELPWLCRLWIHGRG